MRKTIIPKVALYGLFAVNCVNAVRHGADWLFWLSVVFCAAAAVLDIWEVLRRGR